VAAWWWPVQGRGHKLDFRSRKKNVFPHPSHVLSVYRVLLHLGALLSLFAFPRANRQLIAQSQWHPYFNK
jgi:hypothetical protein